MKISVRTELVSLFVGEENSTILHLSDIHLWYSTKVLDFLLDWMGEHKPDIVMLTGDYYDVPRGAHNFSNFLLSASRHCPIVYILGNHDTIYGRKISGLLDGIPDCHCVEDDVFRYHSRSGRIHKVTSWKNRAKLGERNDGVNIILVHNPEKIREGELSNVDLILAGHLHGGQLIFYTTKTGSHFPGNLFFKHCADRKQIWNSTLIANRGLGDTFPIRWNCPKEIVLVKLT
jgi:predicted MPP superfamily phosphohydrolase